MDGCQGRARIGGSVNHGESESLSWVCEVLPFFLLLHPWLSRRARPCPSRGETEGLRCSGWYVGLAALDA